MGAKLKISKYDITATDHIAVVDMGTYTSKGSKLGKVKSKNCQILDIPSGTYLVKITTTNAYNETYTESHYVTTSGKLGVGDTSYFFEDSTSDKNPQFLIDTNELKIIPNGFVTKVSHDKTKENIYPTQIELELQ